MQRYKFCPPRPVVRERESSKRFRVGTCERSRVRRGRIVALCENTGLASISIVKRDSSERGGKFNNLRMNLTFLN